MNAQTNLINRPKKQAKKESQKHEQSENKQNNPEPGVFVSQKWV